MNRKAILFSAPSGSGKTTIIKKLMQYFDLGLKGNATSTDNFRKLISLYYNLKYPIQSNIFYLKYENWKKKVIWKDPEQKLKQLTKEEEDRIYHNPSTLIKD